MDHLERLCKRNAQKAVPPPQANRRPGRPIILPSSHIGSQRSIKQCYEDAMCIVEHYGKPDLFVTVTCNPKGPEIVNNLLPGQTVSNFEKTLPNSRT